MAEAQEFVKRLALLKGRRSNFDILFDQVQRVAWPDGASFLTKRSDGESRTRDIYETTAANAIQKFESAMASFLIPRHLRWHGLKAGNEELNEIRAVKEFFESATSTLFKVRESTDARFYGQMGTNIKSLGAYGNGCIYVDENPSGRGIRYKAIPIAQAWIEVDYHGTVDTLYYEYELTAKAAAQKWPHDVPEKAAKAIEGGQHFKEHTYLHVVQPNDPKKVDPESVVAAGMPFQAWDISISDKSIIAQPDGTEMGGFFEFPYMWSRFTLNPNEIYGRGPAMLSLPDILTLQEMEKTFMRSGHKVADPPLLVAHDGRLGRGRRKIRLAPGGLNYGAVDESGRPKILPLQTGARLDMTESMMERKRTSIEDFFFLPLFDILAKDRVEMTATEVLKRSEEKGQLITPIVGRQQSELLGPMIDREVGILQRQGMLPEVPPELAGGEFDIEYDSLATRMQMSDEVSAYQRLEEVFRPQMQLDATLAQVFNVEDAIRDFGNTMGIRTTLFKSKDEMDEIRAAQAKEAQSAQLSQQALPMAQAAKTASEIKMPQEGGPQ